MGYINNERLPTYLIGVSEELRQTVFRKTARILEKWIDKRIYTGPVKLSPQSCYGIRRYVNGSVLQSHVDRGDTHAMSAILHIGQEDMEEVRCQDPVTMLIKRKHNRLFSSGLAP
jgi:hypothetical protein